MTKGLKNKKPVVVKIKKVAILNGQNSGFTIKMLQLLEKYFQLDSTDFYIFTVKNKKDNYNELRGVVADITDINLFGKIKTQQIKNFTENKYDVLIDFTGMQNNIERYFSLKINTGFRIGYASNDNLYDLMLDVPSNDIKTFIKEMKYYMELLKLI